jgi:hypothetical protein
MKRSQVQQIDKESAMKYDIDNLACFKEDFADSMDQACPGEISVQGADKDEVKEFCIDNLGAFDK